MHKLVLYVCRNISKWLPLSHVTKFDSVKVQDTLGVGKDEGVKCKDLEHLQCGDEGAPPLLDDMTD